MTTIHLTNPLTHLTAPFKPKEEALPPNDDVIKTAVLRKPDNASENSYKITRIYNSIAEKLACLKTTIQGNVNYVYSSFRSTVLTDTKIRQIFAVAFSGYSLIGARAIAGGIFPISGAAFIASTPFVALSGALLWYASSLVDYQNPNTLSDIQRQAKDQPLTDVVKEHGWKNLFFYKILLPFEFGQAYRFHADTLSFKQILHFYSLVKTQLANTKNLSLVSLYKIPSPSEWKQKFVDETKNLTPKQIIDQYPFAELKTAGVLTGAQISILENIRTLLDLIKKEKESFVQEIKDSLKGSHEKSLNGLSAAKQAVDKAYATLGDVSTLGRYDWSGFNFRTEDLSRFPDIGEEFKEKLEQIREKAKKLELFEAEKVQALESAYEASNSPSEIKPALVENHSSE